MKKLFAILLSGTMIFLTSCTLISADDLEEQFAAGQKDAIDKLEHTAMITDKYYINVDELNDYLKDEYGEKLAQEIVYYSDLELYSAEEILSEIVDEYIWKFD